MGRRVLVTLSVSDVREIGISIGARAWCLAIGTARAGLGG